MICFKCGAKMEKITSYCERCGAFVGNNDKDFRAKFKSMIKSYIVRFRRLPVQMKVMVCAEILIILMILIV
ncbi:MAG: hypothetical protein ACRCW0_06170 [Clostridium sp.]